MKIQVKIISKYRGISQYIEDGIKELIPSNLLLCMCNIHNNRLEHDFALVDDKY